MKKWLSAILVCLLLVSNGCFADSTSTVRLSYGKMLALGYSPSEAQEIIDKAERGESIIPFKSVDYETYIDHWYDRFEERLVAVNGSVTQYFKMDDLFAFRISDEGNHEWIVIYALKQNGILVGSDPGGGKNQTVFDGFENIPVQVYGEYIGYSDKYHLPVLQIATYGGLYIPETTMFVHTMTANTEMQRKRLYDLGYLIGAKRYRESTEKYMRISWD